MLGKSNIVLIYTFKDYCALLFMKGALLKDAKGILIRQTKNVQSARQIYSTSAKEIAKTEFTIKAYVEETIEVKKAGLGVDFKKTKAFSIPEEFKLKLEELPALKTAFEALTPGRQRGYILYVLGAKQSKMRKLRVEKYLSRILD